MHGDEQWRNAAPDKAPDAASMVTISYRGDLALAAALCGSVDEFLDARIEHVLVVPRADRDLFTPFAGPRRRIVTLEDALPGGYRRVPVPHHVGFGRWRRRLREVWMTPAGPARGWIVQQIAKLAAPAYLTAETVVFADSDIQLIAPLTLDRLAPGGRTRLYRVPGATRDSVMHVRWHREAARMLGLADRGYLGADYIGNLITWRKSDVLALHERITERTGKRWDKAVAVQGALSEYILYGAFVEHVQGEEASGHVFASEDLAHAGWFYDLTDPAQVQAFARGRKPGQVAVAIQSTEKFTMAQRAALIARIAVDAVDVSPGSSDE